MSATGSDTPNVDATVPDDAVLLRRIPPDKKTYDKNLGRWRPSSDAFCDHRNGSDMSVFEEATCEGVEKVMEGHDSFLLCSLTARYLRSLGFEVLRQGSGGPGHCEVVGEKKKSLQGKMAKEAIWRVAPDDASPRG